MTYPVWIKYVKTISASIVEHCLRIPSWQEQIIFFDKAWNWSLSLINFSINLPNIFKRIISLNIFGVSYEVLLGLGMIIDMDVLKYDSQYSNLKYMLAISINLSRHSKSLIISLIYYHNNLSGSGVKSLLHLSIAERNSCFEKESHSEQGLSGILLIRVSSTC